MTNLKIDSSNIEAITYDPKTGLLTVTYKKTGVYHYYGVDAVTFHELSQAESKGSFIAKRIKGSFRHSKPPML